MSLINEALKKAQSERPPTPPTTVVAQPPPLPVEHGQPARLHNPAPWLFALVGGGLLLCIVLAGVVLYWIWKSSSATSSVLPQEVPVAGVPVAPTPPPASATELEPLISLEQAMQPPAAAPAPPPSPSLPEPNPEVVRFLDQLEVRGVMQATGRALLHNRASGRTMSLGVNDRVDALLPVWIQEIRADTLYFRDDAGVSYIKYF